MSNDKTPAQAAEEEYPPRPFAKVPAHDLNRARRDAFIKGAEWQASQAPQIPGEPTASEFYVAVLVNAMRLPMADQNRLIKDLCERGASQATSPPLKVLTNEMIETVSAVWATRHGADRVSRADFEAGLKEALHGGLLAPAPSTGLTVDQIMDAVDKACDGLDFWSVPQIQSLRDRLTALLDQTPSPR